MRPEKGDIHIEPLEHFILIMYLIYGLLTEVMNLPSKMIFPIVSRINVMSYQDIAERCLPRDGRIPLKLPGCDIDLRISTMQTMFGEKAVIQILNKGKVNKFSWNNWASLVITPDIFVVLSKPRTSCCW